MSTPERTSVAVIGCGHWGQNLVRNFAALGALGLVCDASPAGRARAAGLAPDCPVVTDAAQAFDATIGAVAIATPAETHYRLARAALLAGKDVLCEKPLALEYAQGLELVELAHQLGRILMVGHVLEYHPGIRRLVQIIRAGELGELYYVYSNRLSLGKIRREENILWSFAPHDIAVILRIMERLPLEVVACGGSYLQSNVADVTVTHLIFESGVRAHIHVSWLHPFKEQRLVVIGSRKMASFDDVAKSVLLYDRHVNLENGELVAHRHDAQAVPFEADEPLRLECEAFLAAVGSREPPLTDAVSGARVLQVLQAAQQSLSSGGQPVSLAGEAAAWIGPATSRTPPR